MRYLYRVTVVDPKKEQVILEVKVVAEDEKQVLLKAELPSDVRSKPDKYDILIEEVGEVRAKKEVQKVKISKEDD